MTDIKTTKDVRSYQNGRFIEESYLNGPIEDLKEVIDATKIDSSDDVQFLPEGFYYWNSSTPKNAPPSVQYGSLRVMECGRNKSLYVHDTVTNNFYVKAFNFSWYNWEKLNNEVVEIERLFRNWKYYTRSERSSNINYTNHRSVPIMIMLTPYHEYDGYYRFYLDNREVGAGPTEDDSKSAGYVFSMIVPPGSTYKTNSNVKHWVEIY